MTVDDKDLFTVNEASAYAGLTPKTLRVYIVHGVLPSLMHDGRRLFRRADLDIYMKTRKGRRGRPAVERQEIAV